MSVDNPLNPFFDERTENTSDVCLDCGENPCICLDEEHEDNESNK